MSPDIRPYFGVSPHAADLVVSNGAVKYRNEKERRRKVAICGSAGARYMPVEDPTFECWFLNNFYNCARDSANRIAASRWWEQHQITPDPSGPERGRVIQDSNDMRWIRECPVPLYTTEAYPQNPHVVIWPVDQMARRYRDYFACTFAMQVCQAIDEGFEELHVFGLSLLMGTQRETTVESSCLNWWLGLAEGRGMRVVVDPELDPMLLRHPHRYGHEYWAERRWVERYLDVWDKRPRAV